MNKIVLYILAAVLLWGCTAEPRLPEGHYGEAGQETPQRPVEGNYLWVTLEEGSPEYICFSNESKIGLLSSEGNIEKEIVAFNRNVGAYHLLAEGEPVNVVYPFTDKVSFDGNAFNVSVPSEQRLQENASCDMTAWHCVGTVFGDELSLVPVNGFVGIPVAMEGIDRITIEGEGIAGDFTVAFGETLAISAGSENVISLRPYGESFAEGLYSVSVVPGSYQTLKVSYWRGDEKSSANVRTPSDFARNRISDMSEKIPYRTWVRTIDNKEKFLEWASGEHPQGESLNIDGDIDLGGSEITPFAFDGTIEGNSHKIYNFKIKGRNFFTSVKGNIASLVFGSSDGQAWDQVSQIRYPGSNSSAWEYVGLIGTLHGSLTDVTSFVPVTVTEEATGRYRIGGMVGSIPGRDGNDAVMLRCHQWGDVNYLQTATSTDLSMVGGLVGLVDSPNPGKNSLTMTECSNNGNVYVTQKKTTAVGGLIGHRYYLDNSARSTSITLTDCVNNGDVTFDNSAATDRIYVGGLCGHLQETLLACVIKNCINKGDVSCKSKCYCAGGFIGLAMGVEVNSCTNEGNVTVVEEESSSNWNVVGGLIGFQELRTGKTNHSIVTGCINSGAVSATFKSTRSSFPFPSAGGIVGDIKAGNRYTDNTNTGKITAINLTEGAYAYAGGFAGGVHNTASMQISGNRNEGEVSAQTAGEGSQKVGAGGIVGRLETTAITSCVNLGAVSCSFAGFAGALVGDNSSAVSGICGGSVCGTEVTADNYSSLAQGASSTGTVTVTFPSYSNN